MEKRIKQYRRFVDALLCEEQADWELLRKEHLVQIGFFQHERLIHLIVTVIFAILTFLVFFIFVVSSVLGREGSITLLYLLAAFLVLLIPYIRHYYILENEVQKMYHQYDALTHKLYPTEKHLFEIELQKKEVNPIDREFDK